MSTIIDTPIWSTAFRRGEGPQVDELTRLVRAGSAMLIGAIRQEALQGYRDPRRFELMRERLASFPDLPVEQSDFEQAAQFYNTCRAQGVQGSSTDFLICAISARRKLSIFTTDRDFLHYARILPVTLHEISQV